MAFRTERPKRCQCCNNTKKSEEGELWAAQSRGSQPAAGVELGGLEGPFQPILFYGYVIHMKSLLSTGWRFLAECLWACTSDRLVMCERHVFQLLQVSVFLCTLTTLL